jgi:hypothetical protein
MLAGCVLGGLLATLGGGQLVLERKMIKYGKAGLW